MSKKEQIKNTLENYIDGKFIIFKNSLLKKCGACEGSGTVEVNSFLSLAIPCEACGGKGQEKIQNEFTEILYGE